MVHLFSKISLYSTLLLLYLLCFSSAASAQSISWPAYFSDIDKELRDADYDKALKKLNKLREKEGNPMLLTWIYLYEARLQEVRSEFSQMHKLLELGVSQLEKQKRSYPQLYYTGIAKAANTYNSYGYYSKAIQLAEPVQATCTDCNLAAKASLQQALAAAYIAVGEFNEAEPLLVVLQQYYEGEPPAANNDEAIAIDEDYARLLTLKGSWLINKGDYYLAIEHFEQTEDQVKKLGGKTEAYAAHLAEMARTYLLLNDPNNSRKYFNKAYAKAETNSKLSLQTLEGFVRTYLAEGKEAQAKDRLDYWQEMRRKATSGSDNIYHVQGQIIKNDIAFAKDRTVRTRTGYLRILQSDEDKLPKAHPLRAILYDHAYELSISGDQNLKEAERFVNNSAAVKAELYGKKSIPYWLQRVKQANFLLKYTERLQEGRDIFAEGPHLKVLAELSESHVAYPEILSSIVQLYTLADSYEQAIATNQKLINRAEKMLNHDPESLQYRRLQLKQANLYALNGQYNQAETLLGQLQEKLNTFLQHGELADANELMLAAGTFALLGKRKALRKFTFAANGIYNNEGNSGEEHQLENAAVLADIYYQVDELQKADELLTEAIEELTSRYTTDSRRLIAPYMVESKVLLAQGNYRNAQILSERAAQRIADSYGPKSAAYAEALLQQGNIALALGSYSRAKELAERALKVQKSILRSTHPALAESYLLMGLATEYLNSTEEAAKQNPFPYLYQSVDLVKQSLGEQHPRYASKLKELARLHALHANYDSTIVYLQEAKNIWENNKEEFALQQGEANAILGNVYSRTWRFDKAQKHYTDAIQIFEKELHDQHPQYVNSLSGLARVTLTSGDPITAKKLLDEALSAYRAYMQSYFASLTAEEKQQFWALITPDFEFFNTLAVNQMGQQPALAGDMYDHALITKGMLLSTDRNLRQRILNSNDSSLVRLYKKWMLMKESLLHAQNATAENTNTDKLIREIDELEKELSQRSGLFQATSRKDDSWKNIRSQLADDEAAIEMIRFRYYKNGFTDSVFYAALIVTPHMRQPAVVIFDNGTELEQKYISFYRDAAYFNLPDPYSFEKFWQPIEAALPAETSRIYFSADGAYNQLNPEMLQRPDGSFVIDNYQIWSVSSTRSLLQKTFTRAPKTTAKSALLLGAPDFYTSNSSGSFKQIQSLPGTAVEVDKIQSLLRKNNWEITILSGAQATEERLRQISEAEVVHLATHGFFLPEQKQEESLFPGRERLSNSPLHRSGVLLANGGTLADKDFKNLYKEDGVLTAFEAADLRLDNTELVLLSACETGLGKILVGEGVYGLQRALLVAGADAVIMSLFRVDDEITQELMVNFYQHWLSTGDKREALRQAKLAVKAKFDDPLNWGAFVMTSAN